MSNAIFRISEPENEAVFSYEPGSPFRALVKEALKQMRSEQIEVPMYIGGEKIYTDDRVPMSPPHDHQHILGYYNRGNQSHVKMAIEAALEAKARWENTSWEHRASIFLKAADLISNSYRARINAATMLAQSKNVYQSEIDAVAELADFLRFNAYFMQQIYQDQPISSSGIWNRMEYRALEGFVFCITPFNFTAISGNLPVSPALMGNVCIWKPADSQIYAARMVMEVLEEAGLPHGVINLIYTDGPEAGKVIFEHPMFAGLHFTGSTAVFQSLWKIIGDNIQLYHSYPRIVGETGGKDYIVAHSTADSKALATAITRGAFEFQGQKCSAASRVYLPQSIYDSVISFIREDIEHIRVGSPEDFRHFVNAVIDQKAFDKITGYIEQVKNSEDAEIILGGDYDNAKGYFIDPTVILTTNPTSLTMEEEIFGPVVTIYVYEDKDFGQTLELVNSTSPYALTGAIFAKDRYVIEHASHVLRHSAGNFYINDKPTGAVVGQQPFGGARSSGTNDKAGSYINLLRWVSARTIKENFHPPTHFTYPFMADK